MTTFYPVADHAYALQVFDGEDEVDYLVGGDSVSTAIQNFLYFYELNYLTTS